MFRFNHLPLFARFDEYSGLWAIDPTAGLRLAELFAQTDWAKHDTKAEAASADRYEKNGRSVAILPLVGPLMKQRSSAGGTSTIDTRRRLRQATADSSITSILLSVDSPGGAVAGTQALADDVRAARHKKPVYVQVEDSALSAAFWPSSQADKIFASTPTTSLGSVGTYLRVNATKPNAEGKSSAGVTIVRSGPLKAAGEGDLSPEQLADLQSYVDKTQSYFTEAVRKGRRLSKDVIDQVAQGGLFLAADAQAAGLIDGIQPIEKTLAELVRL